MPEEKLILRIEELWDTTLENIAKRTGKPEISLTTLPQLSHHLFGLKKKEFTVLAGRPSNGKSSLSLQLAYDVAKQGFKVYFFSREMSEESLIERLFCNLSMVNNRDMLYKPHEFKEKFIQFREIIKDMDLVITDKIGVDIVNLYQAIEDLPQADMIVLDYIQTVRGFGKRREVLDDYIYKFKEICNAKNMVGLMVSQINRGGEMNEGKIPQLYQLKETGALEEAADNAILVFWKHYYDSESPINNYDIIIAKQRNGATGRLKVKYFPQHYRFEEEVYNVPELVQAQETFEGTFVERTE